jgi:hypothetical protein
MLYRTINAKRRVVGKIGRRTEVSETRVRPPTRGHNDDDDANDEKRHNGTTVRVHICFVLLKTEGGLVLLLDCVCVCSVLFLLQQHLQKRDLEVGSATNHQQDHFSFAEEKPFFL